MSDGLKELFGLSDEELESIGVDEESEVDPNAEKVDWIVYYKGEQPDCVWTYHHNPDDGIPFGRIEGYWEENKEEKISRHYVANQSNNLKLMDYDTFMNNIIPNKECCKIFESEEDFLLELI